MSKDWKIDLFLKKILGKYYSKSSNGKLELFGIDGLNHAVYAFLIHALVFTIFRFIFKFNDLNIVLVSIITGLAIIVLFYLIEAFQYKVYCKKYNIDDNFLNWISAKNAQYDDFAYPILTSSIIMFIMAIIFI